MQSAGFQTEPSPSDTHVGDRVIGPARLAGGYRVRQTSPGRDGDAAMGRYKSLIGERLRSRGDAAPRTEAVVGAAVLNRMLVAARPNSVRRSAAPT